MADRDHAFWRPSKGARVLMALLFSLIMGGILAFVTLLGTALLWAHIAPASPDDMDGLLVGSLFGCALGLAASATLLWKLWPRSIVKRS